MHNVNVTKQNIDHEMERILIPHYEGKLPHSHMETAFYLLFFKLKTRIHQKNKWNMYGIGWKDYFDTKNLPQGVLR